MVTEKQNIIDPLTGKIALSTALFISKSTIPANIVNTYPANELTVNDIKNGWVHYTVKNVPLQDKYFYFTFFFFGEVLKMVSLVYTNELVVNPSRDNWSEEAELQKAVDYNNWLNIEIGMERVFTWGTISANYDVKGGSSAIVLIYN